MKMLIGAAFALVAFSANAASFDCRAARSTLEIIICADDTLSEYDRQVGEIYFQARSGQTAPVSAKLLEEQRFFLGSRLKQCPIPFVDHLGEEITGPIIQCLKQQYELRLKVLRAQVLDAPAVKAVATEQSTTQGNKHSLCEPKKAREYYRLSCIAEGLRVSGESKTMEQYAEEAEAVRRALSCDTDSKDRLQIQAENGARGLHNSEAISPLMDVEDAYTQECRRSAAAL